jgi:FMN-dependent oxidoreductase (nitrilotriacetate monooxygenase family)
VSSPKRPPRRLRLCAFTMNGPSHIHHGQWARPDTRQLDYTSLDVWVELAQLLERGKFDAVFFADVVGVYESYGGTRDVAVAEGMQIPANDPALVIPAMAYGTAELAFAMTNSVLQDHPYTFARRMSTMDHITRGRIGWNIVTSYLESAARNLGYDGLPSHEERYARAAEYVDVFCKLVEESWDDDAVLRDIARRTYADPSKVHSIDHVGTYYNVGGPHLAEPSPQRTPVLFQAGSSPAGVEFAARYAEANFLAARSPAGARRHIDVVKDRAETHGRSRDDILFFQALSFVVGGTEAEARRKEAEIDEYASDDGYAALFSGVLGIDLSAYDLSSPISELERVHGEHVLKAMFDAAPDKSWTLGDVLGHIADVRIVGTPEQIADRLQEYSDVGVDGINVQYYVTPGSFVDFIDGVTPVLQERGLQQREYRPGTFREKLFDGASGPRLNERHPGARRRHVSG